MSDAIEPFTVHVADEVLADLRDRLRSSRFPDQLPGTTWELGTDRQWLRDAAHYWAEEYDWRAAEDRINAFDHVTTTIDGQRIHTIHQRSPHPDARPLLLVHGWPGSVIEFLDVIGPLTDPTAHGGQASDAFHVVVPSLPGYGWSGPTTESGWDVKRTADAYRQLMARLGYSRYGVQGGDWGSMVVRHLAHLDPDRVTGVHVNMLISFPPGNPDDMDDLTERETAQLARMQDYMTSGSGYTAIQSTKPQSLAYAFNDSPAGLLAWIGEKFHAWTDGAVGSFGGVSLDHLLTNVTVYWVTETIGSSMRMYHESMGRGTVMVGDISHLPIGVANYPGEIISGRRRWAEASNRIVHWNDMPRGGHFAALEQPDLFVDDVRTFFAQHT